jgi:excisionase family DNA binding protein
MLKCVELKSRLIPGRCYNMETTKDVFSVEEAAEYLGVPPYTARQLARQGKLPAAKVGKEWRFLRAALDEYLRGDFAKVPEGTQSDT